MQDQIDWSKCPLIEVIPEVQSGTPVLLGTGMPVSAIVHNFDCGLSVSAIAEQFELPLHRVERIVDYAQSHRAEHRVR